MSKKLVLVLVILIITLPSFAIAATIEGTVYNFNLEKMSDVVLSINTEPEQIFVVKNGTYAFNVPEGDYIIAAIYKTDTSQRAEENISVKEEGTYTLDLIMFPTFEEENKILQTNLDLNEQFFQKQDNTPWKITVVVLIVLLIISILLYIIKHKKHATQQTYHETSEEKDELKQLIHFIKQQGGRTTQKDIRKEFPSSEAKISLMITELEQKGKIEKIKKGRGNIIILK
jgi:uncharacterized membrane protein